MSLKVLQDPSRIIRCVWTRAATLQDFDHFKCRCDITHYCARANQVAYCFTDNSLDCIYSVMANTGLHSSVPMSQRTLLGQVSRIRECVLLALNHSSDTWAAMMDDPYDSNELDGMTGPYDCYAITGDPSILTRTVEHNPSYMFCFLQGILTASFLLHTKLWSSFNN